MSTVPFPSNSYDPAGAHEGGGRYDAEALRRALVGPGRWALLDVVDATGSTNADLAAAAQANAPDRSVLVAEEQTGGRGRLTRSWESPRGSGITVSVLWRPAGVPVDRYGWLPMLAGVALLRAVHEVAPDVPAGLKWPNDLLLGRPGGKAAGILAETVATPGAEPAVVLGIGVNVGAAPGSVPGATSLATEGAEVGRSALLVALLAQLVEWEARWRAAGGDADASGLRSAYRAACLSLGSQVRVEMPGGSSVVGVAEDVDPAGQLLVLEPDGHRRTVAAGDVVHLRSAR